MDWKKILKYLYGVNGSYGGNKGVLPERGKGTAPIPKPQPKTFGEELHEIATPIYEERARRSKEEAEKARKEWEANFNHSAKVVFDIMKDAFVKEANNGYFYYDILLEDIKDMLIAKQVYYYREKDLLEALNRVGQTMGIEVSSYELTKYHVDESGECKEDGYNTWVKFKW